LVYYFHTSHFYSQKTKIAHGTKVIEVSPKDLLNISIPVPPLPIQEEIVRILDCFDKLCDDISKGLPAEIEARQKQYEYYRDKLLTFKQNN
jgi:type I restriction enzyme S subunit